MRALVIILGIMFFGAMLVFGADPFPEMLNKRAEELAGQLGNDDWRIREKVTEELIAIGPPAGAALKRALGSSDAEVSERARKITAILRWKEAFYNRLDRFVSQLRSGKFEDAVLFQDVMSFLGREDSVFILLDFLREFSQPVQARQQIASILGNNSGVNFKPVLNGVLELMKDEKDEQVRAGLLRVVSRAGRDERSIAMMLGILKEGTPNLKALAINGLADMKESSAIPDIIKIIRDAEPNVKNTAVYALSRFRTEESIRELVRFMKEEPTGWVRAQAVAVLSNYGDAKLIPDFIYVLKNDNDFDVLRNAVSALQRFRGDPNVPPALLGVLKTGPAQLKPNIFTAFQALQDKAIVPELIGMLEQETDYASFHATLGTLQSISGNQKFTPPIIPQALKNDIINNAKAWLEKNK